MPDGIRIDRGRFLKNGIEVLIRPEFLLIVNSAVVLSENSSDEPYGIVLGEPQLPALYRGRNMDRYDGFDRREAQRLGREMTKQTEEQ